MVFVDIVHNYLSQSMKNSMVIRMLGRAIRYRPLLVRLQSLWHPAGIFQLVDLENNFYLVKFSDSADFTYTLIGGPWVIFSHYLTM